MFTAAGVEIACDLGDEKQKHAINFLKIKNNLLSKK